jgi:hypothetical protein
MNVLSQWLQFINDPVMILRFDNEIGLPKIKLKHSINQQLF